MDTPLRLGTVPYLNALPLVEGLADDARVALHEDVPSVLARRLLVGHLDAALCSAVELFTKRSLGWIDGPAIVSRGPVRSILLFLRTAPERIGSLCLDTSSLSSSAMARVCLERLLGVRDARLTSAPPDMPLDEIDADAILRIGDPALLSDPGGREALDLGALWTKHTGLPFVYAVWLVFPGVPAEPLATIVREARARGLARRPRIAAEFAARHSMPAETCHAYLHDHVHYALDERAREGLALFGRWAHEAGLVATPELRSPLA